MTWADGRSETDVDIFAMQVLEAPAVGVPASHEESGDIAFANPARNPSVTGVTLRFTLQRPASLELSIYDARGRRVRHLASGSQTEGAHAIPWDLRDDEGHLVAAGVYVARLEADQRSFTQKLVTLK